MDRYETAQRDRRPLEMMKSPAIQSDGRNVQEIIREILAQETARPPVQPAPPVPEPVRLAPAPLSLPAPAPAPRARARFTPRLAALLLIAGVTAILPGVPLALGLLIAVLAVIARLISGPDLFWQRAGSAGRWFARNDPATVARLRAGRDRLHRALRPLGARRSEKAGEPPHPKLGIDPFDRLAAELRPRER